MNKNLAPEPETLQRNEENKTWILLAAIAVVGITTAMLVPAITTQDLNPYALLYSVVLATLAFSGIWRFRHKEVLRGAGLGAVIGVVLYGVANVAGILAAG